MINNGTSHLKLPKTTKQQSRLGTACNKITGGLQLVSLKAYSMDHVEQYFTSSGNQIWNRQISSPTLNSLSSGMPS